MPAPDEPSSTWRNRVDTVGFRRAAIAHLRDRLRAEPQRDRVEQLIHRLEKYQSQLEIVRLLELNPVWGPHLRRLLATAPEVTLDPQVVFEFRGGGNVPNIPTVAGERLYLGSGENFYALDADTAQVIWHLRSSARTWSRAWAAGPRLYVSTGGKLLALAAEDGRELWRLEVDKHLTAPCIHDDQVFAGSDEGVLYALDAATGGRLWTFNVARRICVARDGWRRSIFAASLDGTLYAVNVEDGERLWHFSTGGPIHAPPVVSNGVVYLASTDRKVYALSAVGGRPRWVFATRGEVHAPPVERDGMVYVGSRDKHLYGLAAEDGRELWRLKLLGYPTAAAARRGMVYLSAQGRAYGFSIHDRRLCWCYPMGFPVATAPVLVGRRVYVGTRGGKLVCLRLRSRLEEHGAARALEQFLGAETDPRR